MKTSSTRVLVALAALIVSTAGTGCTAFSVVGADKQAIPGVPIYGNDTYLFVTQTDSKDAQGKVSTVYSGEIKQFRNTSKVLFYIKPLPVVQGKLSVKWGADGNLTEINGESDTKAAEIIKAVADAIPNLAKLFGAGAGFGPAAAVAGTEFTPMAYKLQEDGSWKKVTFIP